MFNNDIQQQFQVHVYIFYPLFWWSAGCQVFRICVNGYYHGIRQQNGLSTLHGRWTHSNSCLPFALLPKLNIKEIKLTWVFI